MPHVVLSGSADLPRLFGRLERGVFRDPGSGTVIRREECYISGDSSSILVRTVVVEGRSRSFYLAIEAKADETVLRLDPTTSVERTAGVKRAVALLAMDVISATGLKIARTNLQEFLVNSDGREEEADGVAGLGHPSV